MILCLATQSDIETALDNSVIENDVAVPFILSVLEAGQRRIENPNEHAKSH